MNRQPRGNPPADNNDLGNAAIFFGPPKILDFFQIPEMRQKPQNLVAKSAFDALGSRRLYLCVEYRGRRYAVEVKTAKNFAGEKSYSQLAGCLDTLGLDEGWMPVFDDDAGKPWAERLFNRDAAFGGKTIHVVGL